MAQGEALQQLIAAMQACNDAAVPRREILEVVLPHLREDDDDVTMIGSLIEHLSDGDASRIIEIAYEALLSGAAFSFIDGRRTRDGIHTICSGIAGEVTFARDGRRRRVTITKLPS